MRRRLLETSSVYRLWQAPFAEAKLAPVWRNTDSGSALRVLDVGCGPGTNAGHFASAEYLGVDVNPRYIASARRRHGDRFAVADVTKDQFAPAQVYDLILVNSLLHHLDDTDALRVLASLPGRLAPQGSVHVIDLVMPEKRGIPRILARLDRGSYPRPLDSWMALFSSVFEPRVFEPFELSIAGVDLWQLVYFKGRAAT